MDVEDFRATAHAVVDVMADYLAGVADRPVFPAIEPGRWARASRPPPPEQPESLEAILADYGALVEPNATHWQHPGFLAYFSTTASGPGILGEMLTAALGQNPMLWRTSPIGTELEGVVVDWLRQALGLPDVVRWPAHRHRLDLVAHRARRSAGGSRARRRRRRAGRDAGNSGRPGSTPRPRRTSSIEKACMTLGLGRAGCAGSRRTIDTSCDAGALAAAIAEDRAAGLRPIAVVATIGTTSSTSVDPVAAMADVAEREGLWLHVDAAYAGPIALIPDAARPVRWLGAGRFDRRQPAQVAVHAARRVAPADPPDGHAPGGVQPRPGVPPDARPRDAGPRLQRVPAPARAAVPGAQAVDPPALLRAGGPASAGSSATSSWPRSSPRWVDADPDWERLAPVPFSTVCFRWRPPSWRPRGRPGGRDVLDERERGDHRRGEPDRRGVPVAHAARRAVHDPAVRSATCAPSNATSSGPGTLLRRGGRRLGPRRLAVDETAART